MTSDTALRPRCLTTLSDGMTLKHDQLVQKLIEKLVCAREQRGVGALIQRGGRAVAGMLTIATAGGS